MEAAVKKSLMMRSTVYKDIKSDVLSTLTSLSESLKLDAKTLASSFDKFMTVSRQESTTVGMEDVEAFLKEQHAAKTKASNLFARQSWEDLDQKDAGDMAQKPQRISPYLSKVVVSAAPDAAAASNAAPTMMEIAVSGDFKERCSNGVVQSVLNEHILAPGVAEDRGVTTACSLQILGQPVEENSRFMMDRVVDKAAYLQYRISTIEGEVEAAAGAHPIATAAQQPSLFVGRICCDTEGGRLNPQSIVLEGSTTVSQGARVPVDVSACAEFRLLPGAVAVVKGTNPSGFRLAATEIRTAMPLPMHTAMEQDGAPAGTSIIVAAGPYTISENLAYEPLAALLEHCVAHKPDVLMLAGPFVDAEHPLVRDGMLDQSFDEIFASRVVAQLNAFSAKVNGKTRVVLLPSHRDVHHDPVFPQGPMPVAAGEEVTSLPNPCTFKCNDVAIGCSTVDWLMSATKEEISQSAAKQVDRLPTLLMHMVNQRSYYPMFPASEGIPLDTTRGYALELPCTPHILVAPSELAPFAKAMHFEQANFNSVANVGVPAAQESGKVVCINPGRLTKGASAGTFVQIYVAGQGSAGGAAADTLDKRCRVEIRKL